MSAPKGWQVIEVDGQRAVVPMNDLHPHLAASPDCWCRPTDDEGVLVHHSADGREDDESAMAPPPAAGEGHQQEDGR